MFWKKKVKTLKLQKYKSYFTTIDGSKHESVDYNWGNDTGLKCSVPDYIMIYIKDEGYIKDKNGNYFPLNNIISISWDLLDEKIVLDNFDHRFQVFFDDNDVMKMDEISEDN